MNIKIDPPLLLLQSECATRDSSRETDECGASHSLASRARVSLVSPCSRYERRCRVHSNPTRETSYSRGGYSLSNSRDDADPASSPQYEAVSESALASRLFVVYDVYRVLS